jgi:indolepyruvate ferredoxin oxidoreductase alpha subunit
MAMREAFQLSEEMGMPAMVRITRALAYAEGHLAPVDVPGTTPPPFAREFMRWVVLPINVVSYHRRLLERMEMVRARFETSSLNGERGDGSLGVIASGFTHQKLLDALGGVIPSQLRVLRLGTFHPLPEARVEAFLRTVESALVLEESAPLVERAVRATAQAAGLCLSVLGRDTGHVGRAGEVFAPHIASALNELLPASGLPTEGETSRPRPSRRPLCDGCPYIPTFEALLEALEGIGGRDRAIVVGDPGCMVRAQLPPYKLLDVKNSLGSSIGTAAGIALGQSAHPAEARQVIALSGDSSFLHTGLNGLMDAARVGVSLLVVVLDNGTTALSGGQPHPGNVVDARGQARRAVDLAALARAAGAQSVQVVDLDRGEDIQAALEAGFSADGVTVVIARGRCPYWEAE